MFVSVPERPSCFLRSLGFPCPPASCSTCSGSQGNILPCCESLFLGQSSPGNPEGSFWCLCSPASAQRAENCPVLGCVAKPASVTELSGTSCLSLELARSTPSLLLCELGDVRLPQHPAGQGCAGKGHSSVLDPAVWGMSMDMDVHRYVCACTSLHTRTYTCTPAQSTSKRSSCKHPLPRLETESTGKSKLPPAAGRGPSTSVGCASRAAAVPAPTGVSSRASQPPLGAARLPLPPGVPTAPQLGVGAARQR